MGKSNFKSYLKNRYSDQLNWYSKKARTNKRLANSFNVVIIIISSILPLIIFLEFKTLSILISIIVTILVSLLRYFNYDKIWKNYRIIIESLKKEKNLFDFNSGHYRESRNKEKKFIETIERIISVENSNWRTIMNQDNKKKWTNKK